MKTDTSLRVDGVNLKGKYVIVNDASAMSWQRVYQATGGFGCDPKGIGRSVFVERLYDGACDKISRSAITSLATDEEVAEAKRVRAQHAELRTRYTPENLCDVIKQKAHGGDYNAEGREEMYLDIIREALISLSHDQRVELMNRPGVAAHIVFE